MEKEHLGRSIVRGSTQIEIIFLMILTGALNWATGETVAVKEIQLTNIPKGELGEIMVSGISVSYVQTHFHPCSVRNRPPQEPKRKIVNVIFE